MREIKVRAWNPQTKMMGDCATLEDIIEIIHDKPNDATKVKVVWLQFTGLLDKNGKEIYEGDIVNTVLTAPAITHWVIYFPPEFMFKDKYGFFRILAGASPEHYEVIGNIYSNPELLVDK